MGYIIRRLCIVVVSSLVAVAAASAQAPDASGRWEVRINAPDGPHLATLTLKKDGANLTGTITAPEGEFKIEGTQKGADVALQFNYTSDNAPRVIKLTGTQQGETIGGPATFGDAAGDWTGKRTASPANNAATGTAAAIDITGAWAFEVTSPAGTGTPTVTFNQTGETLAGKYVGQLGEAAIQGTLRGSELTFGFDVTLQDVKLHVVYTGTAAKDALKGTATFGALGEGTFTARRK